MYALIWISNHSKEGQVTHHTSHARLINIKIPISYWQQKRWYGFIFLGSILLCIHVLHTYVQLSKGGIKDGCSRLPWYWNQLILDWDLWLCECKRMSEVRTNPSSLINFTRSLLTFVLLSKLQCNQCNKIQPLWYFSRDGTWATTRGQLLVSCILLILKSFDWDNWIKPHQFDLFKMLRF